MRSWKLALLGVALFLVFLVATLPADTAYAYIKSRYVPEAPLILNNVQGTVWEGRAGPAQISGQRLDSLVWDINAWALLIGRVQARLEFRNGDSFGSANIARGFTGNVYARDVEARIDLQRMKLLSKVLPLGMQGALLLHVTEFDLDRRSIVNAQGTLAWDNAVITVPSRVELGNLRIALGNEADHVKATLSDGGGPLQAEGILTVAPDGNYKFSGAFAVRDTSQPMLAQGLQFLGRPGPDGKISTSNSGHLSTLMPFFEAPAAATAAK
jgi:general secretion pathway protein N